MARGVAVEADEYDMSAPVDVRLPDGSRRQHWHRETDVALVVDGPGAQQATGDGHLTIIARPPVPPATLTVF